MDKLVSVIMPAYNAARYIAQSIDSVLAQTYSAWELIIVDDGSDDDTGIIIENYCRRDDRIKYVHQENARQGRARNNGIANSSGEYVAFLDSDDLWLPNKLSIQIRAIVAEKADLIFSNTYVFEEDLVISDSTKCMNAVPGRYSGDSGLQMLLQYNCIPILTVLVMRSALERVGGFTELRPIQNAEDYHLWLKMLIEGGVFVCTPGIFSAYREHEASVSGTNSDRSNLSQAIEAISDLHSAYPAKRQLLKIGLAFNIKRRLDNLVLVDPAFPKVIRNYLRISNNDSFYIFFSILELLKMRRVSLRAIYFIINYV